MEKNFGSKYHSAIKIALIYMVISAVYIIFSDRLILVSLQDNVSNTVLSRIQSYKGLAFVLLTSIILFWLIMREIKVQHKIILELEEQKDKLTRLSEEKEKARQLLAERNTYIETILENLPIGLAVNKIKEGTATYMNPKFSEIYGWPATTLTNINHFFEKIFPIESIRKKMKQQFNADIESGIIERMHWEDVEIATSSGERKIVNARNIPVFNQNLMISTVEDVTEKKRFQKERDMLFDTSVDLLSISSFDGYLKSINQAWIKTLGWTEEELFAHPWIDFVYPEDKEKTFEKAYEFQDGKAAISFKNRYVTKNGEYIWLSWNAIPMPKEKLIFAVARDITNEIQTLHQLEFQKNLNQSVFDTAEVGLCVTNEEGYFTQVNEAYCRIYGYSPDELIGERLTKLLPKEQHESALQVNREMMEGKLTMAPRTWQVIDSEGNTLDILVSAKVFEVNNEKYQITSILDVTKMKIIERELKRSREQLENITDNLPGAIIRYKQNANGTNSLTYVSKGSEKIWGISPEDVLENNQLIWNQMDTNDVVEVQKSIEESFNNLSPWNIEWKNTLPNKQVKWLQGIGTPHKQKDGSTIWNSIILDVTTRKQAEKKIREYQKSLQNLTTEISLIEEQQRKEIAANIHDHLSQSLVISKMKLSDLYKNTNLADYQKELEAIIGHISQALENSRRITYDLSPPVLYELGLIETIYWLADKLKEEHQLQVNFSTEYDAVELSDSELIIIYRSIQEIINNAIKYAQASQINIYLKKKSKGMEIKISDNGKGFDVRELKMVNQTNTGFGLFAVRERIQNLKGTFSIISKEGFGTKVKIYIPLKHS